MDKLTKCKEIDEYLTKNNAYMLFNVTGINSKTGQLEYQQVSLEEWLGQAELPASFDREKKYPTRISAAIRIIFDIDESFVNELLTAYKRFLKGDWGELDGYNDIVDFNNKNSELATGYYMTSWGEMCIKQDFTITTAYFPFEN